jgi:hypothetical protein
LKELIYMTNFLRWAVVAVLVGHGLIHLLGVVKGFGWADVAQLKQPIGAGGGVIWLLAALLVLASAALIAVGAPTWWWVKMRAETKAPTALLGIMLIGVGADAILDPSPDAWGWTFLVAASLLGGMNLGVAFMGFAEHAPPTRR